MIVNRHEKGQVLVLLVLGLTALLGFIGLAVDGGHALADRRQAQNTVDAAALSAAIARTYNQNYRDAAVNQIKKNGYSLGSDSLVEVNHPPSDGLYSCMNRPDCSNFIQVKLTTTINTWFAPVVGVDTLTNQVSAVAQALKSTQEPFYGGNAIVALSPTTCQAVGFEANANTLIDNSGIFDNSNCNNNQANNPQKAFYSVGNGNVETQYIKVVGGAFYDANKFNLDVPLATGAFQLPDIKDAYVLPSPACGGVGGVEALHPTVAYPGYFPDFPPDGVTSMEPGIYCVDQLKIHTHLVGGNILFVLSGGVRMNHNAYISLKGRTQGEFKGLLMYMLPAHEQQITIDGNIASEFQGLILAPRSQVTIAGTGKAGKFVGQIIADTVVFTGNRDMFIKYDETAVYWPFTNPRVELVH